MSSSQRGWVLASRYVGNVVVPSPERPGAIQNLADHVDAPRRVDDLDVGAVAAASSADVEHVAVRAQDRGPGLIARQSRALCSTSDFDRSLRRRRAAGRDERQCDHDHHCYQRRTALGASDCLCVKHGVLPWDMTSTYMTRARACTRTRLLKPKNTIDRQAVCGFLRLNLKYTIYTKKSSNCENKRENDMIK
jgi:hypothetical protein